MNGDGQRIPIITPYPWGSPHPANDHVREVAADLVDAGWSPYVVAPSSTSGLLRATRRAVRARAAGSTPAEVLAHQAFRSTAYGGSPLPVFGIGGRLPDLPAARRARIRQLLELANAPGTYCIDPLAPGIAATAARLATTTVVGATMSDGRALPLPEGRRAARTFDYVDAMLADDDQVAAELVAAHPAEAPRVAPAVAPLRAPTPSWPNPWPVAAPLLVVLRTAGDERALRQLLAACASTPDLHVLLVSRWHRARRPTGIPRSLRGRVRSEQHRHREQLDAVLAARPGCAVLVGAAAPERARAEVHAGGGTLLDWQPGADPTATIAAARAAAGQPLPQSPKGDVGHRGALVRELVAAAAERRDRRRPAARIAGPATCHADLHMHTSHSYDCAVDPEALVLAAREVGLTTIAVTDHNEVSGAFACQEVADEYGIQVIIGEEVMTAEGELIGLFLRERVEPGMSWDDTISAIHAQDGITYVPHPFDRLHTIPPASTLRRTVDELDVMEVCNGRLAFEQYNRDARRFARRHGLLEGAGSDAHVLQGLASASIRMPAFDGPEEFLLALASGTIETRPTSYAYVQSLKFLQTRTPLGPRDEARSSPGDDG